VPEHGTMFTLALVRFPPTATKEIQYLNAKGALTYTDIAGDPVLYGNFGFRCCHLKNIWTAPLPPETELSRQMTTSTTSIDIMGLQAAYANLHTDQERDYFMQRYHDVISSFGGKTSYDAD